MRSRIPSKVIFASCLWYFDCAYFVRVLNGLMHETQSPHGRKKTSQAAEFKEWVSIHREIITKIVATKK